MRRLRHLMRKELLELRQDVKLFGILFVAPLIQLTFLGYAATTDVKNVPMIVADADRSAASRELMERFEGSPYFTIVGVVTSVNEVDTWLERGTAWMALGIPAGYHERISTAAPAVVQVIADGTDANSTNVALGYAQNLVATYAQELMARQSGLAAVRLRKEWS